MTMYTPYILIDIHGLYVFTFKSEIYSLFTFYLHSGTPSLRHTHRALKQSTSIAKHEHIYRRLLLRMHCCRMSYHRLKQTLKPRLTIINALLLVYVCQVPGACSDAGASLAQVCQVPSARACALAFQVRALPSSCLPDEVLLAC
jgi:hypothetical protein